MLVMRLEPLMQQTTAQARNVTATSFPSGQAKCPRRDWLGNEPGFVRHTAAKLAEIRGVSLEEIGRLTTQNFYRLFLKAKP